MTAWPYPLWIAHRGAGKLAPENTLAAFRVGAGWGYRAFECDAKLSADGVPFLLHDDTLQRTTPAQGKAGEHSWAVLSRLDAGAWHSRAFAGEPLPTLEAVARFCLHNGFALNIEIKPTPGQEAETGRVVAQEAERLWAGQAGSGQAAPAGQAGPAGQAVPPLLSSFRPEALQAAQQAAPRLPRALLLDSLWAGWFELAQSLACVAVVTHHRLMDAALIERLHGAGLRALVYTVNDTADARRLIGLGIDGIITDAVDHFAPAASTLG